MSRRGSLNGEDLIGGLAVTVLIIGAVLLWVIVRSFGRLLLATATEGVHLYRDTHANPRMRRFVRICAGAMAGLIGICTVAMLLLPATTPACLAIIAWGAVAGLITVEVQDHRARSNDLDDYLSMSRPAGMLGGRGGNAA